MSTIRCNRHSADFIISSDNGLPYLELDLFCWFFILICLIFLYFMTDLVLIIYVLLCNFACPLDCNVTVGLAKFSVWPRLYVPFNARKFGPKAVPL
jgi:hypothetical protein